MLISFNSSHYKKVMKIITAILLLSFINTLIFIPNTYAKTRNYLSCESINPSNFATCELNLNLHPTQILELNQEINFIAKKLPNNFNTDDCHNLLHRLGSYFFLLNKGLPRGISPIYKLCNLGFTHGLFESYPSLSSKEVSLAYQNGVSFCFRVFQMQNPQVTGDCFHGLGHMLGNSNIAMSQALNYCNHISSPLYQLKGLNLDMLTSQCFNGVTMTRQGIFSQNFSYKKWISFCLPIKPYLSRLTCFQALAYLIPAYGLKSYKESCDKLSGDDVVSCYTGLGSFLYSKRSTSSYSISDCLNQVEIYSIYCLGRYIKEAGFVDNITPIAEDFIKKYPYLYRKALTYSKNI